MATTKNILILATLEPHHHSAIEAAAPGFSFTYSHRSEVTKEQVEAAEIIIGNPGVDMLPGCTNVKLISLGSAGANQYCEPGVLPEGVVLTNATGAFGLVIGEWLLGMLLNIYNQFPYYRANQKEGLWKAGPLPYTVYGSTVLIIGAGDIGTAFAERAKALGAHTIGVRRSDATKQPCFDEVYLNDSIDDLLPKADVVALCLPSTGDTHHMIDEKRLGLMKDDAVLMNVGRGTAIDTEALIKTLDAGKLLGVGLDVTDPEPLPNDHPLWTYENVCITPHISGGSAYSGPKDFIADLAVHNIKAYISGEGNYRNIVDLATGYRKL